ncbi:YdbL family protein [uncultured Sneathiella sp.]|uniref:YdbL family protein n=1 Tax=uncultured Sneathiella sp. TaxID=879315 RepID=UPI0030EC5BCB|tara:strand:+ start:60716 stop:61084 length:369 start_codon:yes stop_codon:yes gene_type:complete
MPTGKINGQLNRRTFLRGALLSAVIVSGLPLFSGAAWADQLDDLRASGAVGEAFDGFARARGSSAKAFVDNLNEQRRAIYVKRAKDQNVSVDQVGRVYAAQILSKAPKGTWILGENGNWTQK